jgi:Flp pilus assembly protein TadB
MSDKFSALYNYNCSFSRATEEKKRKEGEKRFLNVSQKQSIRQHKRVRSGRWKNAYRKKSKRKRRENKSGQKNPDTFFHSLLSTSFASFLLLRSL